MTDFLQRLGCGVPVMLAPMAGGPSTPELVAAAGAAGALGSLGAAYLTPAQITDAVARIRALGAAPFAINLFVPAPAAPPSPADVERAVRELQPFHEALGLPPATLPERAAEDFDGQFRAVLDARPAVFSFTFGRLDAARRSALRAAGVAVVIGTATTVAEARALERDGVDAIAAQGAEAGGHRGTFLTREEDALIGTLALTTQVVNAVRVPVLAAGGVMDARGTRAALALGAAGVCCGTAFLRAREAGTSAAFRAALAAATDDGTVLTRAFSGRLARGLRNAVTDDVTTPLPYPYQNALTRPLRNAAARAGRAEYLSLWAGQGAALACDATAAEIVRLLTP